MSHNTLDRKTSEYIEYVEKKTAIFTQENLVEVLELIPVESGLISSKPRKRNYAKILSRALHTPNKVIDAISYFRGIITLHLIHAIESTKRFDNHIYVREANNARVRKTRTMPKGTNEKQREGNEELDVLGKAKTNHVEPGKEKMRKYHLDELPQLPQYVIGRIGGTPNDRVKRRLHAYGQKHGLSNGFSTGNHRKDLKFRVLCAAGIRPWDDFNRKKYDNAYPHEEPLHEFSKNYRMGIIGAHYFINGLYSEKGTLSNGKKAEFSFMISKVLKRYEDANTPTHQAKNCTFKKEGDKVILTSELFDLFKEIDINHWKTIHLKRIGENTYRNITLNANKATADVLVAIIVLWQKITGKSVTY